MYTIPRPKKIGRESYNFDGAYCAVGYLVRHCKGLGGYANFAHSEAELMRELWDSDSNPPLYRLNDNIGTDSDRLAWFIKWVDDNPHVQFDETEPTA